MTVFLRASTKPRGEPNRKKSDTSKSNFPTEPPSSIVLLLDLRETASFRKTLECKLEGQHKVSPHVEDKSDIKPRLSSFFLLSQVRIFANAPGQEGLVLFDRVQFVGGGVTSLAWQLSLGVVTCASTRDVYVTATEVTAALQGRRG